MHTHTNRNIFIPKYIKTMCLNPSSVRERSPVRMMATNDFKKYTPAINYESSVGIK